MSNIYRMVTASSLFDGHDASINLFRQLFQRAGLEVIHIGHNRSVHQIVSAAIQEDAHAVCISSYQGGHMEFFKYLRDRLDENGAKHVSIFGGGGGTILPSEIETLHSYGITRLYHAEDGRRLGLDGVIKDAIGRIQLNKKGEEEYKLAQKKIHDNQKLSERELSRAISFLEKEKNPPKLKMEKNTVVLGVTGPGGAGKSSLVDELVNRFLAATSTGRVGILAFDPTKKMTGGALLGDRVRMNSIYGGRVFLRSMATRNSSSELAPSVINALSLMQHANFDLIILETTGIGQGNAGVVELSDLSMYVMTAEYGASSQLEKIEMIDYADLVAVNKFDKMGSEDAFEDVLHVYARQRELKVTQENRSDFPVFATTASDFNDPGVTTLFRFLGKKLQEKGSMPKDFDLNQLESLHNIQHFKSLPSHRSFYLGEIAHEVREYKKQALEKSAIASKLYKFRAVQGEFPDVKIAADKCEKELGKENKALIDSYFSLVGTYRQSEFSYRVRDKEHKQKLFTESLSNTKIPKIATPRYHDWGDALYFMRLENFPGNFPYTAGVFPLKSSKEDPKRQFAGEGPPERTNKRFHYLCANDSAKRLSTAFDSVTLYGEDPDERLDIYGKIGNSGVSIATLDDMKALYHGFDLTDPYTSISMTINGPAPILLAMLFNTAIDFEKEKGEAGDSLKDKVLSKIRGTVQADILKEEQAQNTCIFSSKFALKLMGDIQEYFIEKKVRNFYSVSISGYHIAEAGANPITQTALTLANGFTYVEYYLSRGMDINEFAPNLSFFFSSGLDPEYAVIGRVARRIWAITLKNKYGANDRSCKLKYHIQTSGRSLHAQEIAFNDIRTTLQALMAIHDNCNSLHTNAYDEAITTPTEESVRRAMAIQMIVTKEYGVTKCENAMQGSFFYQELTELVEEAILAEFDSISRRGGVFGAMEKQYQRHRIQTESMKYEQLKASGELPIIGVNTYVNENAETNYEEIEVVRATDAEKKQQIEKTRKFIARSGKKNSEALEKLRSAALSGDNIFEELMQTVRYASLGQITHLLYECGGEYRRSM